MGRVAEMQWVWEPFTPRGVAAFARSRLSSLLAVQAVVALAAAFLVVWVLDHGFAPTITQAIEQLPASGRISEGNLTLTDSNPRMLAWGNFLAIDLDLHHSGEVRSPAQFQFEFGGDSLLIISLFGELELDYPPGQSFYFNRVDLEPKWAAWKPDLLGMAGVGVFLALMLTWTLLATLYMWPVWLAGFFANRDLSLIQSWKLAGATLMPGAMIMGLSIWFYGEGVFDLIRLFFGFAMHLLVGWIYVLISPVFLPGAKSELAENPFARKG